MSSRSPGIYYWFLLCILACFVRESECSPSRLWKVVCSDIKTEYAQELCDQAYGLDQKGNNVTYTLSEDLSEITYNFTNGKESIRVCTRANLNFGNGTLLNTDENKLGFVRSSNSSKCVKCPARTFCQETPSRLLEDNCECQACSEPGLAFYDREWPIRCQRCPFTCSNVGLQVAPSRGDSCFICNEESSIPDEMQSNCLTLEGWWVENPITREEMRNAELGLEMPFNDRLRRCYPNPDATKIEVKDSLGLRENVFEQPEVEKSHCKRNNLIYPGDPISRGVVQNTPCNGYSQGALCLGCELEFTKRGSYYGNCTECESGDTVGIAIRIIMNIGIVIISVVFTLRLENSYRKNKGEDITAAGRLLLWKVFLSHMQVLSALVFLSIPWERPTIMMFKGGEYLAISRIDFSCLSPEDFVGQELLFVIVFWVLMLVATKMSVCLFHLYRKRGLDLCGLDQEKHKGKDLKKDTLDMKMGAAVIQAILVLHFLCLSMTLQLVSCFSVDYDGNKLGNSYLLKDPKQVCWDFSTSTGKWQILVGVPVLIVLLIVIPIVLTRTITKGKYDFLTIYFKSEFKYWDVVILARKSLFLFCVIFLTDYGEAVEATHAMMVILFSLLLQVYTLPYKMLLANMMDALGLTIIAFTISLGSFKASPATTPVGETVCTVIIWLINILYALLFFVLVCLDLKSQELKLEYLNKKLENFVHKYLHTHTHGQTYKKAKKEADSNVILADEQPGMISMAAFDPSMHADDVARMESIKRAEATGEHDTMLRLAMEGVLNSSKSTHTKPKHAGKVDTLFEVEKT